MQIYSPLHNDFTLYFSMLIARTSLQYIMDQEQSPSNSRRRSRSRSKNSANRSRARSRPTSSSRNNCVNIVEKQNIKHRVLAETDTVHTMHI